LQAYSVIGGDSNSFALGIGRNQPSRGGSRYLDEVTKAGDIVQMGKITASFPLSKVADHHILIAGGIAITAFITAAQYLQRAGESFELRYAVRSTNEIPFKRYFDCLDNITIYDRASGQRLNIHDTLHRSKPNTHIYCCRPQRLMNDVAAAARNCDIDASHVHFEAFGVRKWWSAFHS
jgi:ferredoxin-NADP reductase